MKYLAAIIGIIAWMIFTLLLVCTMIGILVIIMFSDEWMDIPDKLLKVFND